jgi:hypothetical protein
MCSGCEEKDPQAFWICEECGLLHVPEQNNEALEAPRIKDPFGRKGTLEPSDEREAP